ncbi:MAG: HAMP domain-containing histidine kinase, partial [Anaerolineales bacterium]|nr:HAMP domain-containing histidine kinase [Anaerolineales bacterium]
YTESVSLINPLKLIHLKLEDALRDRNQTLHLEGFEGIPSIDVDPDAMGKVLRHLIINAIKYTPDGGTITVKAKMYDPAVTKHPRIPNGIEGVHITIQDTGIGIDPKYQDIIFTKFYQTGEVSLHSSGKIKFKGGGPGLGLAIASGIVKAHNGAIWVESAGHDETTLPGSCFHIVLPFHQTPEVIPAAEQG